MLVVLASESGFCPSRHKHNDPTSGTTAGAGK
jgi:hypothetical protein